MGRTVSMIKFFNTLNSKSLLNRLAPTRGGGGKTRSITESEEVYYA